MSFFASVLAALLPMMFYLILIWRLDKYEREPFGKVLRHFLWGAFGAIFFGIILSLFLNSAFKIFINSNGFESFISAVLVAPIAEEFVKSIYLFRSYRKSFFDNITDGLVYGGAIGLGFGMTENLMYFTSYDESFEQWLAIVITRSIFSAVMHAIATATVGAFLAKAKFSNNKSKFVYPLIGLVIAMLFHATWNLTLSFEFTYYIGIIFMFFLISGFFFVFKFSLINEIEIIQDQLQEEFNFPHNSKGNIYSTLVEQSKKFTKRKNRNKFLNFVSLLAFRKLQSSISDGEIKEKYLNDIELYRYKLLSLLEIIEK